MVVHAHATLADAADADAVLIGSGMKTREIAADAALLAQIKLDPRRQLIGAQCSGTLLLAKLGFLDGVAACTDNFTKPWVQAAGVEVLNQPFNVRGNNATSGGCLASHYLAAWFITRLAGEDTAREVLSYVAPVDEKAEYTARAMSHVLQAHSGVAVPA